MLPTSLLAQRLLTRGESRWRLMARVFFRHRLAAAGLMVVTLIAVSAIAAPLIAPYNPNVVDLTAVREGPSRVHLLGTDEIGRDTLSRAIYGGRVSLSVGLVSVTIYTIIGILLGSVSGFYGGFVDGLIQRLTDTVMCFPSLVIIIASVAILGPSIYNVMIVIGLLT